LVNNLYEPINKMAIIYASFQQPNFRALKKPYGKSFSARHKASSMILHLYSFYSYLFFTFDESIPHLLQSFIKAFKLCFGFLKSLFSTVIISREVKHLIQISLFFGQFPALWIYKFKRKCYVTNEVFRR